MPKTSSQRSTRKTNLAVLAIAIAIIIIAAAFLSLRSAPPSKPVILYVNQGNALVDVGNFSSLVSYAKSNGFNTIFFQVYRSGDLLFTASNMSYFVSSAHNQSLEIFFSLYFTSSNETIPESIYGLGEDGISLDMSTLPQSTQSSLLSTLQKDYNGKNAVTTTNFGTALKPDLLILETYAPQDQQYIHKGIIASVEPLALTSEPEYLQEYQYALSHSDGIMVFDYYGLLATGYSY